MIILQENKLHLFLFLFDKKPYRSYIAVNTQKRYGCYTDIITVITRDGEIFTKYSLT